MNADPLYEKLQPHVGHRIECVTYGGGRDTVSVAVECVQCNEVLVDADKRMAS